MYRVGAGAETGTWDGALVVLGVGVVFTGVFSGWFDPAEACWMFLQEQEFDTIVAELKRVVQTFDRGSMISSISWASFKQADWPVGFGIIRIVRKLTSSIRSFNTKVTTEPHKRGGCSTWLAEANYTDETFVR